MKISSAKAQAQEKKAFINMPDGPHPVIAHLSGDDNDLDGAGNALYCLMEEDTLFNMQDWEVEESGSGKNRRKPR
jgi:hypothetical protein